MTVRQTSPTDPTTSRPVHRRPTNGGAAPTPAGESFQPSEPDPGIMRRPTHAPSGSAASQTQNPAIGQAAPPPTLTADASTSRPSPKALTDEASFFHETRSVIENAQPGDIIGIQMYEFENAAVNGDKDAATNAPGYADQQAILPDLAAAAR